MDEFTKKKKEHWKKVRKKKRSKKLFEIVQKKTNEYGLEINEKIKKSLKRCNICWDYKNIDVFCNFTCGKIHVKSISR